MRGLDACARSRVLVIDCATSAALRERRGNQAAADDFVASHFPTAPPEILEQRVMMSIPNIYNPNFNCMESTPFFVPQPNEFVGLRCASRLPLLLAPVPRHAFLSLLAPVPRHNACANPALSPRRVALSRLPPFRTCSYKVDGIVGSGTFSTVFRAAHVDAQNRPVALKCLKNAKETMDSGVGEARIQSLIRLHDPHGRRHIVRLLDCFCYREHLFLVYERLNASVLAHYMHLETLGPCARPEYWHAGSIGALSIQMLDALAFLASLGITHCDVKTANICIVNAEHRIFKLIDFGSAVLTYDAHMSCVQVSASDCFLMVP